MDFLKKLEDIIALEPSIDDIYQEIKNYVKNEEYRYNLIAKLLEQVTDKYIVIIEKDKYYKEHAFVYASNIRPLLVEITNVIEVLKNIEKENFKKIDDDFSKINKKFKEMTNSLT